ncbi:MAG: zinc-dependent metalloprotease [Bacteroidota bacterium]
MKQLLTVFSLLLLCSYLQAQSDDPELLRHIRTLEAQDLLLDRYPDVAQSQLAIEAYLADKQSEQEERQITLPLVFNVVYSNESERVSMARIASQLAALNRDFSLSEEGRELLAIDRQEGFGERGVDTKIQFCLADLPDAVRYFQSSSSGWGYDDEIKRAESGGLSAFQADRFVNVWVGRLSDDVGGYAQLPGGSLASDGIVIDDRFFGTLGLAPPYDEGKTLTHLMGSYLGLYPLWGKTPCGDDFVEDTPMHSAVNYRCPDNQHVSLCAGYPVEMTVNFMDNTYDACRYLFTAGQKWRMQAVLSEDGPRGGLLTSSSLCASKLRAAPSQESPSTQLQVFPNPAKDRLDIFIGSAKEGVLVLEIFNNSGQQMHAYRGQSMGSAQQFQVDCSQWPEGIYLLRAQMADQTQSRKVTISR